MSIGKIIKKRRQEIGMKANELAQRIGVSQSFLSNIENDLKIPRFLLLHKIAGELKMSLAAFDDIEGEGKGISARGIKASGRELSVLRDPAFAPMFEKEGLGNLSVMAKKELAEFYREVKSIDSERRNPDGTLKD
ncbi:MAG: helix-turn-helix transcriptional regulator [Candidatus Hydrogenedentota bacterium]|nr:MAG: helix-turn-helix transcriptional regulator [Candidatus Hydrogenedentota bacterium]